MILKSQITYQVGVDVLGFPMFVQHKIYEKTERNTSSKFHKNTKNWLQVCQVITEKIFKQH